MRQRKEEGSTKRRGAEVAETWRPVGVAGDAGVRDLSLGSEHQAELAHQEDQPHGPECGAVGRQ